MMGVYPLPDLKGRIPHRIHLIPSRYPPARHRVSRCGGPFSRWSATASSPPVMLPMEGQQRHRHHALRHCYAPLPLRACCLPPPNDAPPIASYTSAAFTLMYSKFTRPAAAHPQARGSLAAALPGLHLLWPQEERTTSQPRQRLYFCRPAPHRNIPMMKLEPHSKW
jgi:hypothetical protein